MPVEYAVFDIDGCISNDRARKSRMPHSDALQGYSQKDYDQYHNSHEFDDPMNVEVVKAQAKRGRDIVFCTGRPKNYRPSTLKWLNKHLPFLGGDFTLLMRHSGSRAPSTELKLNLLVAAGLDRDNIAWAFDDRQDIVDAYMAAGIPAKILTYPDARKLQNIEEAKAATPDYDPSTKLDAAERLREMAKTFEQRNTDYKDNWLTVDSVMRALHGEDAACPASELVHDFKVWHLYELMIVKLTRFANSGLKHADSVHDIAVYAAMIESIINNEEK